MTTGDSDITGVLLAGGQSRRMGGGDKGLLQFGDGTMLGHVIDRFAPQVGRLVLNANGDPARFSAWPRASKRSSRCQLDRSAG